MWWKIVLIVLAVLIVLYNLFCIGLAIFSSCPKHRSRPFNRNYIKSEYGGYVGDEKWHDKRVPFELKLRDNYLIHGDVFINDPKKFVILTHGYTSTREWMIRFANIFIKHNYSIVLYDIRGHADNKNTFTTYGVREHKDLKEVIDYVKKTYGSDIEYGLVGVSMGCNTSLQILKLRKDMKFIVADCGYSEMGNTIALRMKQLHIPVKLFIKVGELWQRILFHFSFKDTDVTDVLKTADTPILFIHGDKDIVVGIENTYTNYEAKKNNKELLIAPNCLHARTVYMREDLYNEAVENFLEKYKDFK